MISASEARKLMYKEAAIEECKRRTEEKIKGAINRGMSRTCLFILKIISSKKMEVLAVVEIDMLTAHMKLKNGLKD